MPDARPPVPFDGDDESSDDAGGFEDRAQRGQASTVLVGIGARGAEDGPTPGQDPAHVVSAQRPHPPVHQARPTVGDTRNLDAICHGAGNHAPDGGIEAGTVPACCENSDMCHRP